MSEQTQVIPDERWAKFAKDFFSAGKVRVDAVEGHQTEITVDPVVVSDDAWWDIIMHFVTASNPNMFDENDEEQGSPPVKLCRECFGTGEYAYRYDPTGKRPPLATSNDTGWHHGWWWKRCWLCHGEQR